MTTKFKSGDIVQDKEFPAITYKVLYCIDARWIRVLGPYREMTIEADDVKFCK